MKLLKGFAVWCLWSKYFYLYHLHVYLNCETFNLFWWRRAHLRFPCGVDLQRRAWGILRAWRSHPSGKMPLYQKYDRVKKDRTGHQYQNDEPKIWKGKYLWYLYCTLYAPDMGFGALVLPDSGLLDIVCMKPIWEVMQLKFHFGW